MVHKCHGILSVTQGSTAYEAGNGKKKAMAGKGEAVSRMTLILLFELGRGH